MVVSALESGSTRGIMKFYHKILVESIYNVWVQKALEGIGEFD